MGEFLSFLSEHYILSSAFAVLSVLLVWSFIAPTVQGFAELNTSDAVKEMNAGNVVLLDVRSENEFLAGHVINSINIPLNYLEKRILELEKHKQSRLIVICQSGARSKQACATLKKAGFANLASLSGGVMAWQHDKLPLHKKR